jgi:hypothetical protein
VLVFPPDEAGRRVVRAGLVLVPAGQDRQPGAGRRGAVQALAKEGWLTGTEGNVVDLRPVKAPGAPGDAGLRAVVEIGFDKWNALQTVNALLDAACRWSRSAEHRRHVPGQQAPRGAGVRQAAAPRRQPGAALLRRQRALLFDSNDNFRPDKKKSKANGRIDGIVATVMALSRAMADGNKKSFWEHDGTS